MIKLKHKAFTLAEVLITLGIIGIVAALTIPILIIKQQKASALSQLKKVYSVLNSTYERGKADYGSIENWDLPEWNAGDYSTKWKTLYDNMLAQSLKVSRYCGTEDDSPNIISQCWTSGYNIDGTPDALMGSPVRPDWYCIYFILTDGTSIAMNSPTFYSSNIYRIRFFVDINGLKAPNTWGKDRFVFYVDNTTSSNYKLLPFGTESVNKNGEPDRANCWSTSPANHAWNHPGTGRSCSYSIIIADDWQIADDYPW